MTKIAFFGHDAGDAAIIRRITALQCSGHEVIGFMMRRGEDAPRPWDNVDLGQTHDGDYLQRYQMIGIGARIAMQYDHILSGADILYARNLDMLACASRVKEKLSLSAPIIYEALDIHHLLTGSGPLSFAMRQAENSLIKKTSLLVYSSPAFEREYFSKYHKDIYRPYLLENRLVGRGLVAKRPSKKTLSNGRLRLGWFGVLRCARTFALLRQLASHFPDHLDIIIRGRPAHTQIPDFETSLSGIANIKFEGAYQFPEELEAIYKSVDIVWAGDFYQAGYNSKWLLPNRLYEGGFYATPAIAPKDSETGKWIDAHKSGFTLPERLETSLPELIKQLMADRTAIITAAENLCRLPDDTFIEPVHEMTNLLDTAQRAAKVRFK
ncbi:MAG: hypothetical protein ACWA5L_09670 [bacterium]